MSARRQRGSSPRWVVAAVLALALLPAPTEAQQDGEAEGVPTVQVGDRVRIAVEGAREPAIGWIDALGREEISLLEERNHAVRSVRTGAIRRLERSRVRRSSSKQAEPGMIAGGMLGLAAGIAFTEEESCAQESFLCIDYGSEKLMAGLVAASLGVLVGGLISAAIVPAESWEAASAPRIELGVDPRAPSLAVAIPLPARRHR